MLKKIVSGGQTGADRAALDFAIKHKIPHGGWVPKGRIAEDGPLPKKYKLTEMPTESYKARTEMNVVGSDGTVISSHGELTGGSAYTEEMATKHSKPCLHLDLNQVDVLPASLEFLDWVDEKGIETLNVAGPRASKDPKIYKAVKDLLESFLLLEGSKDLILQTLRFRNPPIDKDIKQPETVEEAVDRMISELKLKDLTKLAKLQADELVNLHPTVGMWIRSNFVYPRNDKLLESCRAVCKDPTLHWAQMHMVILRELWKRLQETHRLKVVR
jgi:hypothetical protein